MLFRDRRAYMWLWVYGVSWSVACGMYSHMLRVKIVAGTDKLAQAS